MGTKRLTHWIVAFSVVLVLISLVATYYRSVILRDFDVTGMIVKRYDDHTAYIGFVYNGILYEAESDGDSLNNITAAVAEVLSKEPDQIAPPLLDELSTAYKEADILPVE